MKPTLSLLLALGAGIAALLPRPAPGAPPVAASGALIPLPGADPASAAVAGVPQGRVTVLSIDQFPAGMRAVLERERAADALGYQQVDDHDASDASDASVGPLLAPAAARAKLRFAPAAIDPDAGLRAEGLLLPGPPTMPGPWGSVTHVLRRPDGVRVYLHDVAYADSGGAVMLVRELLNASVGGVPARFKLQRSASGQATSILAWATERRYFALHVADDVTAPGTAYDRAWMQRVAEAVHVD